MENEMDKINTQMEEIAYDILNIGETILTLLEKDVTDDRYDETLCQIDSLSKAVGKCCEELSAKSGDGLDILSKQRVDEIRAKEYKLTNTQLEQKVIDLEDYVNIQNGLLESYKQRIRMSEELKAEAIPSSN